LPYYKYQTTYPGCSLVTQACFPHLGLIFVSSRLFKSVIRVKLLSRNFISFCIRRLGIIFIKKCNYNHKLIQRQVPEEIKPLLTLFLRRSYVTALSEMVNEGTKMPQFDKCHVTCNTLLFNPVRIDSFRHNINSY
jgi:hypothetical protein